MPCNFSVYNGYAGLRLKAAWYGAELLGKVVGGTRIHEEQSPLEPITWEEALKEIRADFDNNYFVSGDAEMLAYDPQVCKLCCHTGPVHF
jgi:hypothetical protein